MDKRHDKIETPSQQAEVNIPETRIPIYDPRRFINYRIRPVPYVTPPLSVAMGGTNVGSNSARHAVRPVMSHPTTVYPQMMYPNAVPVPSYVPMSSNYRYVHSNRPTVPPRFLPISPGAMHMPTSYMPYPVHSAYMHPNYPPMTVHNRPYLPPTTIAIVTTQNYTNSGPGLCNMITTYTHINNVPVMTSMTVGSSKVHNVGLPHPNSYPVVFTKAVSYTNNTYVTVASVTYAGNVPVTCTMTYTNGTGTNPNVTFAKTVGYGNDTVTTSVTFGYPYGANYAKSTLPVVCAPSTYNHTNANNFAGTASYHPPTSVLSYTNGSTLPVVSAGTYTHANPWSAYENNVPATTKTYTNPDSTMTWNYGRPVTGNRDSYATVTSAGTANLNSKIWQSNFSGPDSTTRKRTIYQGPISNTENYRNFGTIFPPQRVKDNNSDTLKNKMVNENVILSSGKTNITDDFEEIEDIIRSVTTETVYESADSFKDGKMRREENYLFFDKEFNIWKTSSSTWEPQREDNSDAKYSPTEQANGNDIEDLSELPQDNYNKEQSSPPGFNFIPPDNNQWADYTWLSNYQNSVETTEQNTRNVFMPQHHHVSSTMMYNDYGNNQQSETQNRNFQSMYTNYMNPNFQKMSHEERTNANDYTSDINGYMTNQPYTNIATGNSYEPEQVTSTVPFNICDGSATKATTDTNRSYLNKMYDNKVMKDQNADMVPVTETAVLQEQDTNVSVAKPIEFAVPKPLKIHGKEYKAPVLKKDAVSKKPAIATTNTKNLKLLYKEPVEQPKKLDKGKKGQISEKENKNTNKFCPKTGKNGKTKSKEEEEKPKQKGKQQKFSKKK